MHSRSRRRAAARAKQPSDAASSRDARRLLGALAQEGASPARTDLREGFLVVAAPRNGVTSIIANAPLSAGEELVSTGLAQWSAGARTLVLSAEGRAAARRLAAPPSVDPFLAQHSSLEVRAPAHGETPTLVNDAESPLAWLARRKDRSGRPYLSVEQFQAGERFRRDVTSARILQRVTADWSGVAASGSARGPQGLNVSEMAIAARQRLDRAAEAIGRNLNGLVLDVCGFQKGLELVERERGWPPRTAKIVLGVALERLAEHYGLASQGNGPDRGRMRNWGAEDFRPSVEAPASDGSQAV